MIISCIQPNIFQKRERCYNEIEKILDDLLKTTEKCDLIILPERWVPFLADIPKNLQSERGQDYQFIKQLAAEHSINIISGAIWEKREGEIKPRITSYFINKNGEEVGRQDKIHLYAYEREHFESGTDLLLFQVNSICFAILICFDMAFFETPRLAAENGADLLISPTQIREEGMDNWKIYLQARALENRIPVAACNTFGQFLNRRFLGKSKIISFMKGQISPSKLIIAEALETSGFVFDDIDIKFPRKLRKLRLGQVVQKNKIKVIKIN